MKKINAVVLIDDDEISNILNDNVFSSSGITEKIHSFTNAVKALQYFSSIRTQDVPELIIVDLNMPVMDGYEFKEAFATRFRHLGDRVKIIMLSSSNRQEDKKIALEVGFHDYLIKPLREIDVVNLINKHFPYILSTSA